MENIEVQDTYKKKGLRVSLILHILLIILAILPLLSYKTPPPEQEGIMVNLGIPDVGQGDENAASTAPEVVEEDVQEDATPQEVVEKVEPVEEVVEKTTPKETTQPVKDVVKTEDPAAVALKKKKAEEAKKKREAEEAKRKAAEAARKKKAAEEAERKRKQAEADALADGLDFGTGGGKGNTGTSGNQGDPNGDPNADNLTGLSKGSGRVGGGLGSRGVLAAPKVQEKSQKSGTVVIEVCADANGNVISSNFTQRGSTTTASELVRAAEKNAKKWKFSKGGVDRQCGTITYKFKLQ